MVSEQLALDAQPESPRSARRFVSERLQQWGYADLVPEAELLTSELVTNVVRHVGAPVTIELVDLGDSVVIAVADPSPDVPTIPPPSPAVTGGRGLAIVEGLAAAWGVVNLPEEGKVVWVRLAPVSARAR